MRYNLRLTKFIQQSIGRTHELRQEIQHKFYKQQKLILYKKTTLILLLAVHPVSGAVMSAFDLVIYVSLETNFVCTCVTVMIAHYMYMNLGLLVFNRWVHVRWECPMHSMHMCLIVQFYGGLPPHELTTYNLPAEKNKTTSYRQIWSARLVNCHQNKLNSCCGIGTVLMKLFGDLVFN